ncbi:MAG: hypothetical protein DI536_23345 [Archangium gephyra]|uniref:HTH arsR-type domain-containing protein n=1 Tax=Archangium gephyra TaxID=48 RepID=A0A2W5VFY7_9BACT|nr:MAG: hypothetical protein DI536_23345 [Archangium gephyra]
MVEQLDAVFHALADATRRSMLTHLADGERTVGELAEPFAMSFAGASKHLKVLEAAGLVRRRVEGRRHYFRLHAERLTDAHRWLGKRVPKKPVAAVRALAVEASRRHARVAHEVEDLAHDLILSALRRQSFDEDQFVRSLPGAARRHAAFVARTAGRRRAREAAVPPDDERQSSVDGAPISVLSPALQTTLRLLFAGLEKHELRYALGVSDAALRKRFEALRARAPIERPEATSNRAPPQLRRSQVGALPTLAGKSARVLAASDPDEHGLIFTEVLTK